MILKVNGDNKNYDKEYTVSELLEVENVKMPEYVTVQLNEEFLERDNFKDTYVKDGDILDFLYFMGGGCR